MPIGVAVIDANRLVPIVACDFLLTAFEYGVFEPIVSATVLDEVERTLIDDFPHVDPDGLRRRVSHMRAALADQIDGPAGVGEEGSVQMISLPRRRHGPSVVLQRKDHSGSGRSPADSVCAGQGMFQPIGAGQPVRRNRTTTSDPRRSLTCRERGVRLVRLCSAEDRQVHSSSCCGHSARAEDHDRRRTVLELLPADCGVP